MSKYDALAAHLRSQTLTVNELQFSFKQLEEILGFALPLSARRDRPWWGNTLSFTHSKRWLIAGWRVSVVALKDERVVFVRWEDGAHTPSPDGTRIRARQHRARKPEGTYAPLADFLTAVRAQQTQVAFSFSEISQILAHDLPPIALRERTWWANTATSRIAVAWLSAGWLLESVYLKAHIAVFRRKGRNLLRSIPEYVRNLLDGARYRGRPDAHTLGQWIRFCRQVGWYFEGTVLYEKAGVDLEVLSELERVEVDEDYATCKRELTRYKSEGWLVAAPRIGVEEGNDGEDR